MKWILSTVFLLLVMIPNAFGFETKLSIFPEYTSVCIGDSHRIDLYISGVSEDRAIADYGFDLHYNPLVLDPAELLVPYYYNARSIDVLASNRYSGYDMFRLTGSISEGDFTREEFLEFQPQDFIISSVVFDTVGIGTSDLILSWAWLGLESVSSTGGPGGIGIGADLENGSILVAPVPEPMSLMFVAVGMVGLLSTRRITKIKIY